MLALAADDDLHRLRHFHAHIFRDPGIENISGADAEGHAAYGAHVRRMRVGADIELSRQRIAFGDHRVADALRPFSILQFAVQLDGLFLGELFLLELELSGEIEQSHLLFLFGNDLVEESQMIAEEDDA